MPRHNLVFYFKKVLQLVVALSIVSAYAGSFEDFFRAIHRDDPITLSGLLQRGFDPNSSDEEGRQALHLALRLDSTQCALALTTWPATKFDQRNASGETPLMLAVLRGHTTLAKALLDRGADINMPGWAPLHYAAASGRVALVQLLLDRHAYIDAESPNGTTPLMMAAQYGDIESLRALLDGGADAALKNQLGLTALDFARRGQRPDHIELLERVLGAAAGVKP